MNKTKNISLMSLASALALSAVAPAHAEIPASLLPPVPAGVNEDAIWQKYCIGDRRTPERPQVNYADPDVKAAAAKLAQVSPYSYYFYSGPMRAYGLRGSSVPADFPSDIQEGFRDGKKNAHAYLLQSCGEFRDRPTMIQEKVNWAKNILLLPTSDQQPIDVKKELWSQVSAKSYTPYLQMSNAVFSYKKFVMTKNKADTITFQTITEDAPVDGFTICETKHIFKNYIEAGKQLQSPPYMWSTMEQDSPAEYKEAVHAIEAGYGEYAKGYEEFKKNCSAEDLAYYYDFRGDSNMKHYSPESNGMIWYSSSITPKCDYDPATKSYKSTQDFGGVDMCNEYFKRPFAYRWAAARAGLGAWLFRSKNLDDQFSSQQMKVTILPNLTPGEKPFAFRLADQASGEQSFEGGWFSSLNVFWKRSDMGFNTLMGLGEGSNPNLDFAYSRLRDAVNRHTNWYQSGYDDGMGLLRDQAYSPFVASSYEMSKSDGFTAPGATVKAPADGCKHWMFVFRVHKDNWYTTASLKAGKPVDFNHQWFDETSFGTDNLADAERAWDRLGTALEGEFDSMLYLHNIGRWGDVNGQCWSGTTDSLPGTKPAPQPGQNQNGPGG